MSCAAVGGAGGFELGLEVVVVGLAFDHGSSVCVGKIEMKGGADDGFCEVRTSSESCQAISSSTQYTGRQNGIGPRRG